MEENKASLGNKWLGKIRNSRRYESIYRKQAYNAYKLYNKNYEDAYLLFDKDLKFSDVNRHAYSFSLRNNRANIYYANIETLIAMILPSVPNINVRLRNTKEFVQDINQKKLYDRVLSTVSTLSQYFIDKSLSKLNFKKFKLDYFVTGRGILWVDYIKKEKDEELSIDYVSWLNFCFDPKLEWNEVRWVARRRFLSKSKLKQLFPNVNFEDFHFDANPYTHLADDDIFPELEFSYLATGEKYAEIWELWDKEKQERLILSSQSDDKIIDVFKLENVDEQYFFPTPEPPVLISNGLDLRPSSEVWNYVHEIKELSYIAVRREQLLRSLMLKGFTAAVNSDLLQKINNAKDGDIIASVDYSPENPNIISYIDNRPKVEMMQVLSQEHEFLKNAIYEISGISDQMRNVSGTAENPDEQSTATEIKTKAYFGTRRLQEKQGSVTNYLTRVYELLVYRICKVLEVGTFKKITSMAIPDSNTETLEDLNNQKATIAQQIQSLQQQAQAFQAQQQYQQQVGQQQQGFSDQSGAAPSSVNNGYAATSSDMMQGQSLQEDNQDQNTQSQQAPDDEQQQQASPDYNSTPQNQEMGGAYDDEQQQAQQQQAQQQQAQQQQAQQQQAQQQQAASILQQLQQAQAESAQLDAVIQQVSVQPTWSKIRRILRSDKVQFLVDLKLDDQNDMLKNQAGQQQQLQNSQSILQILSQIMQLSMSTPDLVDVYSGILMSSLTKSGYSFAEQSIIEDYILSIKQQIEKMKQTPPAPPQPSPEDQKNMAAAQELQAKAQLLLAQIQEIQAKIQRDMQPQAPQPPDTSLQNKVQELQLKHQQDMELQKSKIVADSNRAQEKNASDEKLMQMKIAADKERYEEKVRADSLKFSGNQRAPYDSNPI
jgi:hypothetical protein